MTDTTIVKLNNRIWEVEKENEQLKRQVKEYSMRNTVNSDLYDETYEQLEKMEKNYKSLLNENEQLKAQLYCDYNEGVCSICKHHYLEKTNMFYISKCEKGHEKCSKESVRHCEDFKLKELQE